MDRIVVPALPLRARVGVTDAERAVAQDVLIDLELGLDLARAGREDALEHTVDYEKVCDVVAATVQAHPYRLIEAIAEACASAILSSFGVQEVRVRVRKPGALVARGVPHAAVEVVRRRA
ncbi:MAG: dihydroneopterin aldolase [Gemmatimonadales bacterium]